jgi:hypothetical protein
MRTEMGWIFRELCGWKLGGGVASGVVTDGWETFKYLCIWVLKSDTANYYANCILYVRSYCRRRVVYYGIWFVRMKLSVIFSLHLIFKPGKTGT